MLQKRGQKRKDKTLYYCMSPLWRAWKPQMSKAGTFSGFKLKNSQKYGLPNHKIKYEINVFNTSICDTGIA